jgi:flap endonuclease-1
MGCDYCDTIKGIGYKRAYELIIKHGNIENIIENEKIEVPDNFNYKEARTIFMELSSVGELGNFEVMYEEIDRTGLIDFLVNEKGFDETRVVNGIEKMVKSSKKGKQVKIDSFFKKSS